MHHLSDIVFLKRVRKTAQPNSQLNRLHRNVCSNNPKRQPSRERDSKHSKKMLEIFHLRSLKWHQSSTIIILIIPFCFPGEKSCLLYDETENTREREREIPLHREKQKREERSGPGFSKAKALSPEKKSRLTQTVFAVE